MAAIPSRPGNLTTVLITGANRGIGLEFARQYAQSGHAVIATCRNPADSDDLRTLCSRFANFQIEPLDISGPRSVSEFKERLGDKPIDILINNAGTMGALPFAETLRGQHFGSLDYAVWDDVLRTNTLGTVRLTESIAGNVAASAAKKIITISSTTGSISESRREAIAYTTSKAALNKAMTLIADQLRKRGIIVALLCPGYVKTRMNVGGATVEVEDSVSAMRRLIDHFTLADTGTFRRYDGQKIAW